jgi:hypothetical protein
VSVKDLSDIAVMLGLVVGCGYLLSVVVAIVRLIWASVCGED